MAWQTPKTDWMAPDGVRFDDINRIEGNILELYNTGSLHVDKTIYVATTGNDNAGTGTYASPYATITKALSTLPKQLNNFNVTISIDAGTYDDNVLISGFNTPITLSVAGVVYIKTLTIDGCTVKYTGNQLNIRPGTNVAALTVLHNGVFVGSSPMYIDAGTYGISISDGGKFILYNTLTVSNATYEAIDVSGTGSAYIATIAGTGNAVGVSATTGGVVGYGGASISATTRFLTASGGKIYTGAQASIPNY